MAAPEGAVFTYRSGPSIKMAPQTCAEAILFLSSRKRELATQTP